MFYLNYTKRENVYSTVFTNKAESVSHCCGKSMFFVCVRACVHACLRSCDVWCVCVCVCVCLCVCVCVCVCVRVTVILSKFTPVYVANG